LTSEPIDAYAYFHWKYLTPPIAFLLFWILPHRRVGAWRIKGLCEMGILLAFAPFIGFAVVDRLLGSTEGLCAGFAISAVLLLRDWLSPNRTPKVLEIGTAVLFGGLALYALISRPDWSLMGVRLAVDCGLLLIVMASIAIRQPFTLQYAREQVPQEVWASPEFVRTNYVITAVWALAFVVLVVADLALLYVPELPPRFGIIVTILALVGAIKFTSWYPAVAKAAT
jgi:hypothetical protein